MWNELAVTVVAALVASASDLTKKAVNDAYALMKSALSEMVPRFSTGDVTQETAKEKAKELECRLQGLATWEREAIEAAAMRLAGEVNRRALQSAVGAAFADEFIVEEVEAKGGDVTIKVVATGGGRDHIKGVKARGSVSVSKDVRKL